MCGIVGIAGAPKPGAVLQMTRSLIHRGPDDEGIWEGENIAVGMRRLSIIDLKSGAQPIWSGKVGIVYNGEIYNFREKRTFLEKQGIHFKTNSDTEVILELYKYFGTQMLEHLNGMFAFCIVDKEQQKLFIARDRLGIKPLYYGVLENRFFFASEIKAILKGLNTQLPLNFQAIHHYLTLRFIPEPQTSWQGILKLEPGHFLEVDLNKLKINKTRYWKLDFRSSPTQPEDENRYIAEFGTRFTEAVKKRLETSDVPVGVFLSGGLDSSAVSLVAKELGHSNFHSFNIRFSEDPTGDESRYAKLMAEFLGTNHHEIELTQKEFLDFIPDFVYFSDEPMADLASIPTYFLSKLASKYVKVVLSGEGSDEILGGYNFDQLAHHLNRLRLADSLVPRPLLSFVSRLAPSKYQNTLGALSKNGLEGYLKEICPHMTNFFTESEKSALWRDPPKLDSTQQLVASWYQNCTSPEPLDQVLQVYCGSWLVEDLLMKADKMSMAASLELRVPFLDYELVEWAEQLPLPLKFGQGNATKRILREYVRGKIPSDIIDRPKAGFPVPAYLWLRKDHPQNILNTVKDWILSRNSRVTELFNQKVIETEVLNASLGYLRSAHRVWHFIILEHWLRRWT